MQFELVEPIHWHVKYLIGTECDNISMGYSHAISVVAMDVQAAHDVGEAVVKEFIEQKREAYEKNNANNKDAPPFDGRTLIESVVAKGKMYVAGKII